jgi:3-phosphoshikimate 1-carboxyvinyltransferase
MRLLMGMLATIEGRHELVGDRSLSRRPMDRVAVPLRLMGAEVEGVGDRLTPPIRVQGRPLRGIRYATPVPSAQVKSAILLAGLAAEGRTVVLEAQPTRPNTEEMLLEAGAELRRRSLAEGDEIEIEPCSLQPREWRVPADPSQAAFGIVAAVLAQEGHVRCEGLYGDPTRVGFLGVLARMGAAIESGHDSEGLLAVTASSSSLNATIVLSAEIPSVDEVPILTIAAAAASGTTRFVDVGELRIKESDRFAGSMALARGLGAGAEAEGDDLLITGLGSARQFRRLTIDADGDHRVAMAAAVAGLVGAGAQIEGFEAVATSYPGFLEELAALQ